MPTTTPYYGLTIYNNTTDGAELFSSFRALLAGTTSTTSNMYLIDTALQSLQGQLSLIPNGAEFVSASEVSTNAYSASGIESFFSYVNGLAMVLLLNVSNTGTCTLDVNGLGAVNLCKIDSTGTIINVASGDLIANKLYYFTYYATKWVLINNIVPSELASTIHGATSKTTPVDADEFVSSDSAATWGLKKITWANMKATLGTPTGTIVGTSDTQTLTNKRINPRVQSVTDAATITPNADTNDAVDITALAQTATIANPSGTPVNFQELIFRIKDNASPQTISWDTAYVPGGVALVTTTSTSKTTTCRFIYNTANALNKWMQVSAITEA